MAKDSVKNKPNEIVARCCVGQLIIHPAEVIEVRQREAHVERGVIYAEARVLRPKAPVVPIIDLVRVNTLKKLTKKLRSEIRRHYQAPYALVASAGQLPVHVAESKDEREIDVSHLTVIVGFPPGLLADLVCARQSGCSESALIVARAGRAGWDHPRPDG